MNRDHPVPGAPTAPPAPQNVRVAGALVALQGVAGAVLGIVFGVRALSAGGPALGPGLAEGGFFLVLGAAVAAVGYGLVRGRRATRTPAIVVELLLLPVVYSLLSSRQLLWGILGGILVILTFLLLISSQARRWSIGDDYPDEA